MSIGTKMTGGLVAAILLAGTYTATFGLPERRPYTNSRTTTMPKAKKVPPRTDGRVYAVIQICARPYSLKATFQYWIEPKEDVVSVDSTPCTEPFTRKGAVSPGFLVKISWAVAPATSLIAVQWRITVNNQVVAEAVEGGDKRSTGTEFYLVKGGEGA